MAGGQRIVNPNDGFITRILLDCPQIGIVKDNIDPENMGRLKVWIKGSNTLENDPSGWITCAYASPFAGASDPDLIGNNLQAPDETQQSYGLWAVPPDLGNSVIVLFINGDIRKAFWVACIWQKNMNYMVPGVAEGASFQSSEFGGGAVPVAEYNKLGNNPNLRPVFEPLADGLDTQGLLGDSLRGAGSSSARRESPSQVYGWKTPGGNQFIMDDGSGSELIRIRTKSGAQILVSETEGHIYAISRDGKCWIELNNDGYIDAYSLNGINFNTGGDMNLRSEGNVNIEAGGNVNVKGQSSVDIQAATDNVNISSAANTNVTAGQNYNLISKGDTNVTTHGTSASALYGDVRSWHSAGGYNSFGDNLIHPATPHIQNSPVGAVNATTPTLYQQNLKNDSGNEAPITSICDRIPDAEPWPVHAPTVLGLRQQVQEGTSTASTGSVVPDAEKPLPVVGSPSTGMSPGVYTPQGYTPAGKPIYTFTGPTTALTPVNQLVTSQAGLDFIAGQEGFSANKYKDASGFSIGYGHFIIPTDPAQIQSGPISQETALQLLAQDVKKAENTIQKYVKVPLTQSQFDALVDFIFNVGAGNFQKSTLLQELNQGNYADVPNQLMRWNKSQGKVLAVLTKRRRLEGLLFAQPVPTS